jgi:hypothetical protein
MKPGTRWKSAVCDTEVVVVRAPADAVALECGGQPMVPLDADQPGGLSMDASQAEGTLLGKRYAEPTIGLELLCTKPGAGSLSVAGERIGLKEAKPLPSSD